MELLTNALVIVLLSTAAFAKPITWPQHHDADIADNDLTQGWLEGNDRLFWRSTESSSYEDSSSESKQSPESWESSESSESQSSEESSEEVLITDQTTPVVTTAMTTIATADETTPTPEPGTASTDEPASTTPPATPNTPGDATSPECVECFTVEIPTEPPTTENRGDN